MRKPIKRKELGLKSVLGGCGDTEIVPIRDCGDIYESKYSTGQPGVKRKVLWMNKSAA
jgi:hypothetical protein